MLWKASTVARHSIRASTKRRWIEGVISRALYIGHASISPDDCES
jgi:hypothetical protein